MATANPKSRAGKFDFSTFSETDCMA